MPTCSRSPIAAWKVYRLVLLAILGCSGGSHAHDASPAVTLVQDSREYRLGTRGDYHAIHTVRIHINDARALETARIQDFDFNARFERLELVAAYVQRPDGRRLRIRTSDVGTHPSWQAGAAVQYRDVRALRVVFNDLHVGDDIVVVTRQVSRPDQPFSKQFTVLVAPNAPVIHQGISLTIDAPAGLPLHARHTGFAAAAAVTSHGRTRYRWIGDGSGNPDPEPDAANESAFRAGLEVTSFASPSAAARAQAPAYRASARATPAITALAARLVRGVDDERGKALIIHRWVQERIRYQGMLFGREIWLPLHSAAQVLRRRAGDCKDHVVLMGAMLAAVGIASTPAQISWGLDLYTLPTVVHEGTFNHVITFIPSLNLYLDATNTHDDGRYLAWDQLDKVTLLIDTGEIGHTPASQSTTRAIDLTVAIAGDQTARFSHTVRGEGDDAGVLRRQYGRFAHNESIGWGDALLKQHGWHGRSTDQFGDTGQMSDSYTYRFQGSIDDFVPAGPAPEFAAASSLSDDIGRIAGIFSREQTRTQPRPCDASALREHATYTWPAGLDIDAVPADLDISNPVVRYAARYRRDGNSLSIDRHLEWGKAGSALCSAPEALEMAAAMLAIKHDTESRIRLKPAPPA